MKYETKVKIIIPVYNASFFLAEATDFEKEAQSKKNSEQYWGVVLYEITANRKISV